MTEPEIDRYGHKRWTLNGVWHREGGPAIIYADGDHSWYQHGLRHREDGPAVEWFSRNHFEYWYKGEHIKIIKNDKQWKTYLNCKLFW